MGSEFWGRHHRLTVSRRAFFVKLVALAQPAPLNMASPSLDKASRTVFPWISYDIYLRRYTEAVCQLLFAYPGATRLIFDLRGNNPFTEKIYAHIGCGRFVLEGDLIQGLSPSVVRNILISLGGPRPEKGETIAIEGAVLFYSHEGFVARVVSPPEHYGFAAFAHKHHSERNALIENCRENPQWLLNDPNRIAQALSEKGRTCLREAIRLIQNAIESESGERDDRFALAITGSMSYGPHLGSDIDVILIHKGRESYFRRVMALLITLVYGAGWKIQNLCEAFNWGMPTIDLVDSGKISTTIMRTLDFALASRDLEPLTDTGQPEVFADFQSLMHTSFHQSDFQHWGVWVMHDIRGQYLESRRIHFYRGTTIYDPKIALQKLKQYYNVARIVYGSDVRGLGPLFVDLGKRGMIAQADSDRLVGALDYFLTVRNTAIVRGYPFVRPQHIALMADFMGYHASTDFHRDWIDFSDLIDQQLASLRSRVDHHPQFIKWASPFYAFVQHVQKSWDVFWGGEPDVSVRRVDQDPI